MENRNDEKICHARKKNRHLNGIQISVSPDSMGYEGGGGTGNKIIHVEGRGSKRFLSGLPAAPLLPGGGGVPVSSPTPGWGRRTMRGPRRGPRASTGRRGGRRRT